jgi:hypothetical protein
MGAFFIYATILVFIGSNKYLYETLVIFVTNSTFI